MVRQGANVVVIPLAELDYAVAQDDYVGLHAKGKEYLKPQTLADLESSLDPKRFVRIHRSYLMNLERLARLESEGGEVKTRAADGRYAAAGQPLGLRAPQGAAVEKGHG